eukprot:CAMPEP_0174305666 /NCGR_PEP_ID=MMETSP0809-20121228/61543_1 /TAXON_ID=73025 ORGANISM="Eutreptiella gymnastica-like, Strain CCMP1594" /NCGR_SAMPLE_ID=MMETSP0809 /ASSEMBLY_ACC=CAM_ASM_000658 /LENGTH=115 /DNA_ID=CAMNT_0015412179 /DNA_START=822 /DNA_END=1169 /DNA_ORIENTATION=-
MSASCITECSSLKSNRVMDALDILVPSSYVAAKSYNFEALKDVGLPTVSGVLTFSSAHTSALVVCRIMESPIMAMCLPPRVAKNCAASNGAAPTNRKAFGSVPLYSFVQQSSASK